MKFLAEIKQTKQIKKASLDQEYQILLVTNNPEIMDLGKLPYETIIEVEIKVKEYDIVTGKQIGRASCRERVSSPV